MLIILSLMDTIMILRIQKSISCQQSAFLRTQSLTTKLSTTSLSSCMILTFIMTYMRACTSLQPSTVIIDTMSQLTTIFMSLHTILELMLLNTMRTYTQCSILIMKSLIPCSITLNQNIRPIMTTLSTKH